MNKQDLFIYKNSKIRSCFDIQMLLGKGTHIYVIIYLFISLFLLSSNKDRDRKEKKTRLFS